MLKRDRLPSVSSPVSGSQFCLMAARRPYKRRRYLKKKRASSTAKFSYAGSGPVPRDLAIRQGDHHISNIVRMSAQAAYVTNAATDDLESLYFTLDTLPNYTEFTSLYDQYRIVACKVEFCPLNAFGPYWNGTTLVQQTVPNLFTCIDVDDAITPTASAMEQHESVKNHGAFSANSVGKFVRWVKPKAALDAYQTAGFTGFGTASSSQWFDCNSPSVQYYGIKWWLFNTTGTPVYRYLVTTTYYMEFKYSV